jgi:hypothetical protein
MKPDLRKCDTSAVGMCDRSVLNGITYCCRPCREAHNAATVIGTFFGPGGSDPIVPRHSEECNSRHKVRGAMA